jgi:cell division transport system ATP-binding protein
MRVLIQISKEQKTAVLMATHDMSLVEKFPQRVFRVEQNSIKEVESLSKFDPFTSKF